MGQIKNIKLHIVTDIKCQHSSLDHLSSTNIINIKMQFPLSMMHDTVWMDRLNYIEAEEHIHLTKTPQEAQQAQVVSSSLVSEISSMRENIKTCVSGISNLTTTDTTTSDGNVQKLEAENKSL